MPEHPILARKHTPLTPSHTTFAITGCAHTFHHHCMREWSIQCHRSGNAFTCPICRSSLRQDLSVEEPDDAVTHPHGAAAHEPGSVHPVRLEHPVHLAHQVASDSEFGNEHTRLGTHYIDVDGYIEALRAEFIELRHERTGLRYRPHIPQRTPIPYSI